MIEKITVVSQIEVTEANIVQVRTSTIIIEDGNKIGETYHRHCIAPGDDYSAEDAKVQSVCAAVHTQEVVSAYQAELAAQAR